MATTMQVAMERWYGVSLSRNRFPVNGLGPCALAFDGQFVWVANGNSGNVSRLRACDGRVVGTYGVPGRPMALAFDGASVWVSTQGPPALVRLRAADGSLAGTYPLTPPPPLASGPWGLVFDGAFLWVLWTSNLGGHFTRLRTADGTIHPSDLAACGAEVGTSPLVFDGARIWDKYSDGSVGRFDAATGALVGTTPIGSPGQPPTSILFDGIDAWVGSSTGAYLARVSTSSGAVLNTYALQSATLALGYDGQCVWQVGASRVRRIRRNGTVASDHEVTGLAQLPPLGGGRAMVFDGASMWVLGANDDVLKL